MRNRALVTALVLSLLAASLPAQSALELRRPRSDYFFEERADGSILAADAAGTYFFVDWGAYVRSAFFQAHGLRCGSERLPYPLALGTTSDCNSSNTNVEAQYEPEDGPMYVVPVVFHVIRRTDGTGEISDALLQTQIDVLNEDFGAFGAGSPGTDTRIQFTLAGVTRSNNNTWYDDNGTYYNSLAWDPTSYLNIYTNTASGNLGYAYLPSGGGVVGNLWDRVVCYWPTIGRPGPYGDPYDLGRTATHEVGHYLGLYHTFQGGCSGVAGCFTNGDLICDTLPESGPNFSPCNRSTCGDPDPTHNYMDYSDDVCMNQFTPHQANRMRCTLDNFRVDLATQPLPGPAANPSPAHAAGGVSVNGDLAWSPGSDATSHDVYFGTNPSPGAPEFQGNQPDRFFDPGALAGSTAYYWRIDEVNSTGTTTGPVWSFTTEPSVPPGPASGPLPLDGASRVGRLIVLSWSPGSDAVAHNVHFGTTNPPPYVTTQGGASFDPGALGREVTYYWRIDEINAHGTATGTVWSFTTGRNFGRDQL